MPNNKYCPIGVLDSLSVKENDSVRKLWSIEFKSKAFKYFFSSNSEI